ncbi:hypothetical protein D1006_35640 [Burkholderia stabilis]|uniref:Uncharacterized protein n=1 Tax=Burkholderia stabilis TaxID=95485 RepID=A0A4Q2A829_9BURK|nr:hypothetical protein [Burkholderia stabilis]RXV65409.1 hypothetical protein D1006_35640 [Burkholderia stabilis]
MQSHVAPEPRVGFDLMIANAFEPVIADSLFKGVAEIVIERGLLTCAQFDEILQPTMLTLPRKPLDFN